MAQKAPCPPLRDDDTDEGGKRLRAAADKIATRKLNLLAQMTEDSIRVTNMHTLIQTIPAALYSPVQVPSYLRDCVLPHLQAAAAGEPGEKLGGMKLRGKEL